MLMPLPHCEITTDHRRRHNWRTDHLLLCGAIAFFLTHAAEAADFSCSGGNVPCLIDAINAANGNGEANTIRLDASIYSLTVADNFASQFSANGLPVIVGQITITGAGQGATVIERVGDRANMTMNFFRLFSVAPNGALTLEHLTLRNGNAGEENAGAILSEGALTITDGAIVDNTAVTIGAIQIGSGTFVMNDSRVSGNRINAAGADIISIGNRFGLSSQGPGASASIVRSTIADNSGEGGAVFVDAGSSAEIVDTAILRLRGGALGAGVSAGGTVVITNSTIAGIVGSTNVGVQARGPGPVTVVNSTIANNSFNIRGPVRLQNTTLAGSTFCCVGDCDAGYGSIVSLGHNVFEQPKNCGPLSPSDLTVGAGGARLGNLVETGTLGYIPLLADSPAIDAADAAACPATDQRGLHRPIDGNGDGTRACDAGAIEFYPVVNDLLQLDDVEGSYLPPNGSQNPLTAGGEFHITATFTNVDPRDVCHVAFDVVTLQGAAPPVVLTQNGVPIGGQGAAVTAAAAGASTSLPTQTQQQYQFRLGVPQPEGISFFVNVLGEATAGPCSP